MIICNILTKKLHFTITYNFENRYLDILEFSSRFDYGLINNPNAGTFGYEVLSDTLGNLEIKDVVAKEIDALDGKVLIM